MDCQQTTKLLSNYFDGELSVEQRIGVADHIKNCAECLRCLSFFSELSAAIRNLSVPRMPSEMRWQRITAELDETSRVPDRTILTNVKSQECARSRWRWALLSTAVLVLIALGLSWSLTTKGHHEPLQSYVNLLETNPRVAQQHLAEQYSARTVSPHQAEQLVGYRPHNVDTPPRGFVCEELVVLDMPCCKCVQAVWQREDKSHLAVFEHKSKMDDWFADQPSVRIECAGTVCRVTQLDGQLAASWRVGSRVMTANVAIAPEFETRVLSLDELQSMALGK